MKMMKRFLLMLLPLAAASCGYHAGGVSNPALAEMKTYNVRMFENRTLYPYISLQMTTALNDRIQRDGTFRLATPANSDIRVEGCVESVSAESLLSDTEDTYISREIGLTIKVSYKIVKVATGEVVKTGKVSAEASYFNTVGNIQAAREEVLSYAARKAAELIVDEMTLP